MGALYHEVKLRLVACWHPRSELYQQNPPFSPSSLPIPLLCVPSSPQALARENAEARLFWSLLDETYGSDYQAFFLYSLNLIENIAGTSLRMQWGK